MSWFSFALSVIKLLTVISTWLRERQMIETGKAAVREEELRLALSSLAKANGIVLEFREKSDADVEQTLEERKWYRD
jgi:hypothetical protein